MMTKMEESMGIDLILAFAAIDCGQQPDRDVNQADVAELTPGDIGEERRDNVGGFDVEWATQRVFG
jgi:hypothetical protein